MVPGAGTMLAVLAPVGTIFINLIRVTVIPLVASMLVASVGALASSGALARVAARALAVALALVLIAVSVTVVVAAPVFARIHIDEAAALSLRGGSSLAAAAAPASGGAAVVQWLVDLVSPNIIKAAADGAMLPVILFAALFGIALAR